MSPRTQTRTETHHGPDAADIEEPQPAGSRTRRREPKGPQSEPRADAAARRREAARRRRETGRAGEELAARYLADAGWTVLDRNWRPGGGLRGELDVVALEPPAHGGGMTLVAVEVKTRTSTAMGEPAEAVGPAKLARLRALAIAWAVDHEVLRTPVRVDVVSVLAPPGRTPLVRHHRGVGI